MRFLARLPWFVVIYQVKHIKSTLIGSLIQFVEGLTEKSRADKEF
jgi:hypothetical protein